jgi:hypothetical protein
MKAPLFGALDAALAVITMWVAASIALIPLGYSSLGPVSLIGVVYTVGFLAGVVYVARAPDILKRRKRRRAVDTIFWMLSFSVVYLFGISLFRPPYSILVAIVETMFNPFAWALVVVAAVRNRVGNAQPSSPVVPMADGGRKQGTVGKAEHFADIPGMPFDSLDDLRDAVERREVDLRIAMDYARQWLVGGTGRPLWARVVCELLGMLPITFGAPLVHLAWRSFGATSVALLVPVCLSWLILRPAWLRLRPELLWISRAWLPIALVGAGSGLPWVSWIAVAIGGPCILNGLMYRLASDKARDAALQDETLFLAFWNAGGVTAVTTNGSDALGV